MLPEILYDFNAFINRDDFQGVVKSITWPKITKRMVDIDNGGMSAIAEVPVGFDKIMCTVVIQETQAKLVRLLNDHNVTGLNLRFLGNYYDPNGGTDSINAEVIMTGTMKEMDMGEFKRGEQPETKFEFCLTYYEFIKNGESIFKVDALKPFVSGSTVTTAVPAA